MFMHGISVRDRFTQEGTAMLWRRIEHHLNDGNTEQEAVDKALVEVRNIVVALRQSKERRGGLRVDEAGNIGWVL